MHIIDNYSVIYYVSRIFGAAQFELKTINNVKIVRKSKFLTNYTKLLYLYYVLFVSSNSLFNSRELYILKNVLSKIFYILELCVHTAYIFVAPILYLKHTNLLCSIQNRLNQLFTNIVSDKNKKLKHLQYFNNFFLLLNVATPFLGYFCNVIELAKNWTTTYSFVNMLIGFIRIPIGLMTNLASVQYIALANIIRAIYSEINKNLSSKTGKLEISFVKSIDDCLKDIFDDINSAFSVHIWFKVSGCFLTSVNGIVLLITERDNVLTLDFIVLVIYFVCYMIIIIKTVSLLAAEVRKSFFS